MPSFPILLQENLFFDSTAYGSFGTCMSFMMVFRTAQSYTRYWVAWVKSLRGIQL
jgi:predicted membrane chloride channel (bestrophin family)